MLNAIIKNMLLCSSFLAVATTAASPAFLASASTCSTKPLAQCRISNADAEHAECENHSRGIRNTSTDTTILHEITDLRSAGTHHD